MERINGISINNLVSFLAKKDDNLFVLDCRSFIAYNYGHVVGSVNVYCPPIVKRRSGDFVCIESMISDAEQRRKLTTSAYGKVIAYDDSTHKLDESSPDGSLNTVLKCILRDVHNIDNVVYLIGGYEAFSKTSPWLCVTSQQSSFCTQLSDTVTKSQMLNTVEPVEILPNLFLGNYKHSSNNKLLDELRITAIVNVSYSCQKYLEAKYHYLHVSVRDDSCADLLPWFPITNSFIEKELTSGGRVLVHCDMGRSRSVTVCLAFLMMSSCMSLETAFDYTHSRCANIDPNLNFMRQLKCYDRQLQLEKNEISRLLLPNNSPLLSESHCSVKSVRSVSSSSSPSSMPNRFISNHASVPLCAQTTSTVDVPHPITPEILSPT